MSDRVWIKQNGCYIIILHAMIPAGVAFKFASHFPQHTIDGFAWLHTSLIQTLKASSDNIPATHPICQTMSAFHIIVCVNMKYTRNGKTKFHWILSAPDLNALDNCWFVLLSLILLGLISVSTWQILIVLTSYIIQVIFFFCTLQKSKS